MDRPTTHDRAAQEIVSANRKLMPESIRLLEFVAGHYGFIILFGLISYLIGLRLTRRIAYDSWWEELSVSISLGFGVIASLTFLLGLLGLLYRFVLMVAFA